MPERDYIVKNIKIRQQSIFDMSDLYKIMFRWFTQHNYDFQEKQYMEQNSPRGKHLEIGWETAKKISDYIKFHIDMKFLILGLDSVEIDLGGLKKKTNKGDITLELFMDKTPITAGNFVKLVREGFYNGTKFHRVIAGFMIQGGDPSSKGDDSSVYGTGGPGYTIQDEFVEELSNVRGTISMANIGQPNSGGSQFFINLGDNTGLDFNKEPLTSKHPVFGKVAEGMDVVDAIAQVDTDSRDVPVDPLIISEIIVDEK